jgi:hypothetical protein
MAVTYYRDRCGNLTFLQDEFDNDGGVPLEQLVEIAKREFPDPEEAIGTAEVIVAPFNEHGNLGLVMACHHHE